MYLAIKRSGIVFPPENIKQSSVGANSRVEMDPNHFSVVGGSGADQFVIRVMNVALRVAHFSLHHALHSLKCQFYPPEATGGELRQLQTRLRRRVRVGLQGWVG